MPSPWASEALLRVLRQLQRLPLPVQAAIGRGAGRLLWWLARSRRRVALTNLALCFPERPEAWRRALAREHFGWLGRSLLERGLLWYAPVPRLKALIHVEGDVGLAERSARPVMWLVPHFLALDVAGVATQLFQTRKVGSIYQQQSDPVFDAAMRAGRLRFDGGDIFPRSERALPLIKAIRRGWAFFNLPDMDFGARDADFVPFFGVSAATLLAPSRMARALDMVVQPVVAEMLPGGAGYRVRFLEPWADFPTDDPLADARRMNAWIEQEILRNPAQYLWVHRRFKTRPPGEASFYR
ncbi:LpxL/LpxP family acyltransferase [Piscinibacter sakaiensis]|uniref:Lipid A biosynthesis lauroyl acyltransferase n=1 Tax=Piscinibacter sakaiensis TaxID=1547922 RepID=A0A0K8P7H4_PISS1|nr:lipid A biosynthesis acyltransferase [Piscinibacter sakaiensis]GAP38581.1 lipid A biosynthesis lauroyl acyltransferase [Piscinibacter sakaiensis]